MVFKCNLCNKEFKQNKYYEYHINRKNKCINEVKVDGKIIHKCDKCDKVYTNKTNYNYHISRCNIEKNINIINNDEILINNNMIRTPSNSKNIKKENYTKIKILFKRNGKSISF